MLIAPLPFDEEKRLASLRELRILDTGLEQRYDEITRLASHLLDVPIALISLVDDDRQWFKSRVGLSAEQTPRDVAFCAHAIHGDSVFYVPNALKDRRFLDNPLVTGEPHVVAYAGAPLITPDKLKLGTLCAIDRRERNFTESQLHALQVLANQVSSQFELRRTIFHLSKAKVDAESAVVLKSNFVATVSHELRTPLNGILGFADELLERQLAVEEREMVRIIRTSGNELLHAVNNVLDAARLEADEVKLSPTNTNVKVLVSTLVKEFSQRAIAKNLFIEKEFRMGSHETIHIDETRLKQVVSVLIDNAIKYTDEGEIHVLCEIKTLANESIELNISVSDTGMGIKTEDQTKVLEKTFIPSSPTSGQRHGGIGLGLSICQLLIKKMGGELQLQSIPGVGTKAMLQLICDCAQPKMPQHTHNEDELTHHNDDEPTQTLDILIAEDNDVNYMLIETFILSIGHKATRAKDGNEAINRFQQREFDMIIMDMQMPNMGGLEAARAIIAAEKPNPPIIALSASTNQSDMDAAFAAGMVRYLAKPIDKTSIKQAIASTYREYQRQAA